MTFLISSWLSNTVGCRDSGVTVTDGEFKDAQPEVKPVKGVTLQGGPQMIQLRWESSWQGQGYMGARATVSRHMVREMVTAGLSGTQAQGRRYAALTRSAPIAKASCAAVSRTAMPQTCLVQRTSTACRLNPSAP